MRWRFWRRASPDAVDDTARRAAQESAQLSARRLEEAHGLTGEVERVVRELQRIRVENNLAGWVRAALGERR